MEAAAKSLSQTLVGCRYQKFVQSLMLYFAKSHVVFPLVRFPKPLVASGSGNLTIFPPELCKWGPSCATILREQFSHCDYDCATCTLHGSIGEGANEEFVELIEVDQVGCLMDPSL